MKQKFELKRIEREILRNGKQYTVYRTKKDKYGESTDEKQPVLTINGLFHLIKGYIQNKTNESTTIYAKGQPKLLILFGSSEAIMLDDFILINKTVYRVVEKNNIEEYNMICDLSLEAEQNEG